jgi:DNA-3-methyladenine glycosylase II
VQRGLLRWVLSLHEPEFRIEVSPQKLPDSTAGSRKSKGSDKTTLAKSKKLAKSAPKSAEIDSDQEDKPVADELPTLNGRLRRVPTPPPEDVKPSLLASTTTPARLGIPLMPPPPLTPSVTQVLSRAPDAPPPPPLPPGLTIGSLRNRLNGKNKVKYVTLVLIRV